MSTKLKHKLTSLADLIEKVFCPTGAGGGVDPTCGRGGGSAGSGGGSAGSVGGSVGSGGGNAVGSGDVQNVVNEIGMSNNFGFETMESRGLDRLDFHEVGVWGVRDGLTEAYQRGSGGKKPPKKLVEQIAKDELHIETLEERKSDRLDFHEVSVASVSGAIRTAYEAGQSAKAKPKK